LVIIGGFQLVLFYWQLRLIRKSQDDAKTPAEASKSSADAAKVQAEIAQTTLSTMQDTAERQLRAYMCMHGGGIRLVKFQEQMFIEGYVRLKNFGQTPAYDHRSWVRIEVRNASQPPFDILAEGLTKAVISPNGEANTTLADLLTPLLAANPFSTMRASLRR
jgi:hypothetical protein